MATFTADAENRWAALIMGLFVVLLVGLIPFLGGLVELIVLLSVRNAVKHDI